MKSKWNKIVDIIAIIGMLGSAFGILGGVAFKSYLIMIVGLSIWALALIIICAAFILGILS